MKVPLKREHIDSALGRCGQPLAKYLWLQQQLHAVDVSRDQAYQRAFNSFYRVRRNAEWQTTFFNLMERVKRRKPGFRNLLAAIRESTGRLEVSFASKLLVTLDPSNPVIDSVVLKNLGIRLPGRHHPPTFGTVRANPLGDARFLRRFSGNSRRCFPCKSIYRKISESGRYGREDA